MATITQTGYVISSPEGISCGLRGVKVYLYVDDCGRICEYKNPVAATFIPTICSLRKKIRTARCWYPLLNIYPTTLTIVTTETAPTPTEEAAKIIGNDDIGVVSVDTTTKLADNSKK